MQHSQELEDLCNDKNPSCREIGRILKESAESDRRARPWLTAALIAVVATLAAHLLGFF